jgi:hypothetical protein
MHAMSIFSGFPVRRCSVTMVLIGCLTWILGLGAPQSHAQEIRELPSDSGISGKQPAIYWHDKDAQFDLDSSTDRWTIDIKEGNKPLTKVTLPAYINQVYSIRRADASRIVVLAHASAGTYYVGILRTDASHVIDEFWTSAAPGISPDNRYILLVRFYPMHGAEGYDDQYRLYDVLNNQTANWPNRPAQAAPAGQPINYDASMAGVAVYPLDPSARERQNTFVAEGEEHARASLFVWDAESRRVVFGDYTGGALSFVIVAVPTSGERYPETSVYRVPTDQNPCSEVCLPKNIGKLEWVGNTVTVQLTATPKNGPARVSHLSVPVTLFVPVDR